MCVPFRHPKIHSIHLTGSAETFNCIVWGTPKTPKVREGGGVPKTPKVWREVGSLGGGRGGSII